MNSTRNTLHLHVLQARAAQQFLKWGVQVRERSERKNFFDPPTFGLPGGDIKQDITVFISAIMTYKRLCLPAPNDRPV